MVNCRKWAQNFNFQTFFRQFEDKLWFPPILQKIPKAYSSLNATELSCSSDISILTQHTMTIVFQHHTYVTTEELGWTCHLGQLIHLNYWINSANTVHIFKVNITTPLGLYVPHDSVLVQATLEQLEFHTEGTWQLDKQLTSCVIDGLNCLCSSIMILRQIRTFSSFSVLKKKLKNKL
jgi:hypothetical protein